MKRIGMLLAVLASGAVFGVDLSWFAQNYDSFTNALENATVGAKSATAVDGVWSVSGDESLAAVTTGSADVIAVDTELGSQQLSFVPTPVSTSPADAVTQQVFDVTMTFATPYVTLSGLPTEKKAGLALYQATSADPIYMAYLDNGAWKVSTTTVADASVAIPVRITLTYGDKSTSVAYEVKTGDAYEALGVSVAVALTTDMKASVVAVTGYGSVSSVAGTFGAEVVAEVNGTYYTSLKGTDGALSAAGSNVIKLLADATADDDFVGGPFVFNMNGHSIDTDLLPGSKWMVNTDGSYTYVFSAADFVARIGEEGVGHWNEYTSLADAFAAAESDDVITILSGVDSVSIPDGTSGTYKIDRGGATLAYPNGTMKWVDAEGCATYTFREESFKARIGAEVGEGNANLYWSLVDAAAAAQDKDTITVLAGYTETSCITFNLAADTAVTLDLNGQTVNSAPLSTSGGNDYLMRIFGATVTLTNGVTTVGKISKTIRQTGILIGDGDGKHGAGEIKAGAFVLAGGQVASEHSDDDKGGFIVRVMNGSFTMNGGEIVAAGATNSIGVNASQTATINGGIVNGYIGGYSDSNKGTITIPGTSTAQFEFDFSEYCADGYKLAKEGEATYYTVTATAQPQIDPSNPTVPVEVEAKDAADATNKVQVVPPTPLEGGTAIDTATYAAKFVKTAVYNETTGKWTVTAALTTEAKNDLKAEAEEATTSAESGLASKLAAVATSDQTVSVTATPGFYYSVEAGATLGGMTEGERTLADGSGTVELTMPKQTGNAAFYRVLVNTTK